MFLFLSCETDFDVNAAWKETTVVFGLLDAGKELQQVKIGRAFLGEMDALQMAQYADSTNYADSVLDVKIYKFNGTDLQDSISLTYSEIVRDGDVFNDNVVVYEFPSNSLSLERNRNYTLVVKNKITDNIVTSSTSVIDGFVFDIDAIPSYQYGLISSFNESTYIVEYSNATISWEDSYDNGKIYQLDLIFHYTENGVSDSLIFSQPRIDDTEEKIKIEGEDFFNFLKYELTKDNTKVRSFDRISLVMTIGSEDLKTYMDLNIPNSGIVQERPHFTNINNGIGLFSSRFTKRSNDYQLTSTSLKYLESPDGLDRNFE